MNPTSSIIDPYSGEAYIELGQDYKVDTAVTHSSCVTAIQVLYPRLRETHLRLQHDIVPNSGRTMTIQITAK